VRAYLRETLLRNGYRVLEAADGRVALELAERYPGSISLLVADVVMPEVGGPELARLMVAARPRLRVVLVTGYGGDEHADELDGLAVETLEKPFTTDAFVAKVREVLDESA
jgi:DNA-binding NtrC family response regulator